MALRWFDVVRAADELGSLGRRISVASLYRWSRRGYLATKRFGRLVFVAINDEGWPELTELGRVELAHVGDQAKPEQQKRKRKAAPARRIQRRPSRTSRGARTKAGGRR